MAQKHAAVSRIPLLQVHLQTFTCVCRFQRTSSPVKLHQCKPALVHIQAHPSDFICANLCADISRFSGTTQHHSQIKCQLARARRQELAPRVLKNTSVAPRIAVSMEGQCGIALLAVARLRGKFVLEQGTIFGR